MKALTCCLCARTVSTAAARARERIAAHMRNCGNREHITVAEHMPSSHRRYAGWTIDRIPQDTMAVGPATSALCEQILESRPHPEQGFRAYLGAEAMRLTRERYATYR
jgi:transposase